MRELWARAKSCWEKILLHESKSILVVAHNAVNQALVATAIGIFGLCLVCNLTLPKTRFILISFSALTFDIHQD